MGCEKPTRSINHKPEVLIFQLVVHSSGFGKKFSWANCLGVDQGESSSIMHAQNDLPNLHPRAISAGPWILGGQLGFSLGTRQLLSSQSHIQSAASEDPTKYAESRVIAWGMYTALLQACFSAAFGLTRRYKMVLKDFST